MEGRKIIKWWIGGIGIAIVIGYSYLVLDDYVRGPRIIIESPLNGYSTTTPAIVVIGRGIHTNNLSVNGAQTPVDLEGNFRAQLILAPGYNIIKVTAKDNYERTVEKIIEIALVIPKIEVPETVTTTEQTENANITIPGCIDGHIFSTITGEVCDTSPTPVPTGTTTTPMELTAPKGLLPTGQATTAPEFQMLNF